jgi:hypothetical protein
MQLKKILIFAMSFVLLYVPVAPVTASPMVGQMFTKGNARINGVAAPHETSIFPGDRISTERGTTTALSFSGGDTVVISEMSKASLNDRDSHTILTLEDGTVSALNKSPNPVVTEAHGARIVSASNQAAVYDVILHGNALRVVSRGGVVHVETANKTADLQPGTELDATMASPDPPPAGAGLNTAEAWIVVATAAAAATAVVLGVVAIQKVDNCHLSPSKSAIIC